MSFENGDTVKFEGIIEEDGSYLKVVGKSGGDLYFHKDRTEGLTLVKRAPAPKPPPGTIFKFDGVWYYVANHGTIYFVDHLGNRITSGNNWESIGWDKVKILRPGLGKSS